MGCCQLFGPAFAGSNILQIMTLMKYSLELSDPWVSHYHDYNEDAGVGTYRKRRNFHRLWLADNENELRKRLLRSTNVDILRGWR